MKENVISRAGFKLASPRILVEHNIHNNIMVTTPDTWQRIEVIERDQAMGHFSLDRYMCFMALPDNRSYATSKRETV